MEEIYTLLSERLTSLDDLINRINQHENGQISSNINQQNKENELQEILNQINQMKRTEKMRIIKENEFIEVIFTLRNFDLQQRQRFQIKSMEIMKKINAEFNYDKFNTTGEIKDISKQYLKFFLFLKLSTKAEDLKRVYASNKFISYPIISILMKWLVEISRKQYQDLLKVKLNELNAILVKYGEINSKTNYSGSYSFLEESKNDYMRVNRRPSYKKALGLREDNSPIAIVREEKQRLNSGSVKNCIMKPGLRLLKEEKDMLMNPKEVLMLNSCGNANTINYESNGNNFSLLSSINSGIKNINDRLLKYRCSNSQNIKFQQANIAQIFVPNNPNGNRLFDPMEDLDLSHITTVYQVMHLYKNIRKNQAGTLMIVDLEKKKEMVINIYRNLYQRNLEIEKTINWYKTKFYEKSKSDYKPSNTINIKKAEAYLEKYQIDFFKRFPHMVLPQHVINDRDFYRENDIFPLQLRNQKSYKTSILNLDFNFPKVIHCNTINESVLSRKESNPKFDDSSAILQNLRNSIEKINQKYLPELSDMQATLPERPNSNVSSTEHISPVINQQNFRFLKRPPLQNQHSNEDRSMNITKKLISKKSFPLNENHDTNSMMVLYPNEISIKNDRQGILYSKLADISNTTIKDIHQITTTSEFKSRSTSASAHQHSPKNFIRKNDSSSLDENKYIMNGRPNRILNGINNKRNDERKTKPYENYLLARDINNFYPSYSPKTNLLPLSYKVLTKDLSTDRVNNHNHNNNNDFQTIKDSLSLSTTKARDDLSLNNNDLEYKMNSSTISSSGMERKSEKPDRLRSIILKS